MHAWRLRPATARCFGGQRSAKAYTIGALSVVLEITDVNVTSELSALGPLQGSGLLRLRAAPSTLEA
jgi:hypothetical protein